MNTYHRIAITAIRRSEVKVLMFEYRKETKLKKYYLFFCRNDVITCELILFSLHNFVSNTKTTPSSSLL